LRRFAFSPKGQESFTLIDMRKSLRVLVLVLFISSPAFAQKATRRASNSKKAAAASRHKKKHVVRTDEDAPSPDAPKRSSREMAIRKVGVANLAASGGISPAQAANLTRQLVNDLTAMSYLEASAISGSLEKSARGALLKTVNDSGLDGVLLGLVSPDRVKMSLLSRTGDLLASISLDQDVSLANDGQVKATSRAIVDEVARAIPYRGFVTRRVGQDRYEINLGQKQGLLVGQRFRLFDFEGGTLDSGRQDICEVEVVQVSDSTAIIEPTGAADVKLFAKVGFNENARGMSLPQQVETRGYVRFGGGLLNISGTGDPKYIDRAYNVSSAPGFLLGGGWNKWVVDILFAQAKGEDTDFVYTEIIANNRLFEAPFGGLNRFSVWAGARAARVSITTKRNIVTPLESTTSISPEFEARLDRIIKGPVRGFIAASAYFPIFVSGMDAGALLFSYGIGGDAGLSLDLSQRLFLDVGARYHLLRRPVEGQTSVNETYTELFGDLGYRF
jgi:hypothetical protein